MIHEANIPMSFDLLVDRALEIVVDDDDNDVDGVESRRGGHNRGQQQQRRTMVDLGSGCGRLVFYAALTRGGAGAASSSDNQSLSKSSWDVHGVEIGTQLHSLAVNSLQRGVEHGWFESINDGTSISKESREIDGNDDDDDSQPIIAFHNGNALLVDDPYFKLSNNNNRNNNSDSSSPSTMIQSLLSKTNILFAYSTVWETNPIQQFNPELQAMILSPKWSETLASLCPSGCVAITTDRALNPVDGWKLVDRMEVENPSVWGSVGYVSVLEK
ncbi:hypothetical protein ACHAXR_002553 [Thalassiosira sp. AJA248-18]